MKTESFLWQMFFIVEYGQYLLYLYQLMTEVRGTIKSMLEKGQDPKDYLIEVCRPQCTALQQKLQRCETALKNMTHADPELSCMYPLRDWVTCVDSCVQPKIHAELVGNQFGFIS